MGRKRKSGEGTVGLRKDGRWEGRVVVGYDDKGLFGEWVKFWYENHCKPAVRPNTRTGYENNIRLYIRPRLGGIPLNKLTANDLQQFINWMRQRIPGVSRRWSLRQYNTSLLWSVPQGSGESRHRNADCKKPGGEM